MRESAYIAEIDLKALRPVYGKVPTFAPISRFAKETRDLALVMSKSVTCGEVEKAIAEASSFVQSVQLFDVYEGSTGWTREEVHGLHRKPLPRRRKNSPQRQWTAT